MPLVASHPVYQYFARRYALNLKAVLWEPDVVPDDNAWAALKRLLKTHRAQWMIWEGKPIKESVKRLKQMGVLKMLSRAGATEGDIVWIGEFSFEYQPDL